MSFYWKPGSAPLHNIFGLMCFRLTEDTQLRFYSSSLNLIMDNDKNPKKKVKKKSAKKSIAVSFVSSKIEKRRSKFFFCFYPYAIFLKN